MHLTTERLIIRQFFSADADDIHSLFCLPEVMQPVGMAPAFTDINQTKERLAGWIDKGIHHAITLSDSKRVIGYIVVKPDSEEGRDDTRELGFALHPDYQHNGYMTEAVEAVLAYLRQTDIRYVWACCFKDNYASRKLIERCGFVFRQEGEYTVQSEHKTYSSLEYRMDL